MVGLVYAVLWIRREELRLPDHLQILLPSEDCIAPCWQGIHPGKSSTMDIYTAINTLPDVQEIDKNTWTFSPDSQHVYWVGLNAESGDIFIRPQNLTLGEWMMMLGAPDFQTVQVSITGRDVANERVLQLYYQDAQITLFVPLATERLSTHTPIESIRYGVIALPFNAMAWQGFVYIDALPSPFETGKN